MAKIRTSEQLQQLFQERREIQQRKKEREKLKYKKAAEQIQKQLQKKFKKEQQLKQQQQKEAEEEIIITIPISVQRWIEKQPSEEDLYLTRQELQEAEQRGEGKINWNLWDELVEKTKHKNDKNVVGKGRYKAF